MKTITFKPEFEQKLKSLRIKTRFVNNLRECRGKKVARAYASDNHKDWDAFISGAFSWADTPEGHMSWSEVARK